jgi:hypothetical protein
MKMDGLITFKDFQRLVCGQQLNKEQLQLTSAEYIAYGELGYCILCKCYEDLRMRVCAGCAKYVDGEHAKGIGHRLWDIRHPEIGWWCYEN